MAHADPTEALRQRAAALPGVDAGTSCTQTSFKAGNRSFLFVGPGRKGQGFKAMFRLAASLPEAEALAAEAPERFEIGSTGWVTARFTAEDPLPPPLGARWLLESHALAVGL